MTTTNTDLLGKPLTEQEQELLNVYEALKKLAAQDDLSPCVARNVRQALASIEQHPKFDQWKDEMAPGEMWSLFGEKWLAEAGAAS